MQSFKSRIWIRRGYAGEDDGGLSADSEYDCIGIQMTRNLERGEALTYRAADVDSLTTYQGCRDVISLKIGRQLSLNCATLWKHVWIVEC